MNAHTSLLLTAALLGCNAPDAPPGAPPGDVAPPDRDAATEAAADDAPAPRDAPDATADAPDATPDAPDATVDAPDAAGDRPGVDASLDAAEVAPDGSVDAPREAAAEASVAPDVAAPADGGAFSDVAAVTPRTTRVGPQTGGRIVYSTSAQKGAFWELPGGDVLTSVQTARTNIRPGVAIYDLEYRLRRISGTRVVSSPDNVIGVCRDDGTPRACDIGPDADGPSGLSLVTPEGAILLIARRANPDGRSHLAVVRLDPATGTEVPVAEYPELRSARADRGIEPHRALRSLGTGQTVLTAEMVDVPPRTLVLAADGAVVARADGFALGDRWDPFSVLLASQAFPTTASFRWWNARTGAVTPAYALPPPPTGTNQSFRGLVAPSGDLLFHDFARNHRLIHVAPDGRVVEDRPFAATSVLLGALASGAYLAFERSGTSVLNGSLRARVGADPGTLYYTDAMLVRDAGWSPNPFGSSFPYLLGPNAAVIDDAGNAYVGFVLQTGGNTQTRTWLAAFAPDGRRLWGVSLPTCYGGEYQPRAVLSGRRIVATCPGRFTNGFVIVGE